MTAAGVRMAPISPGYRLHTISYCNLRKITVIDCAIGYTSGMNIGREHLSGGAGFESWRDTQLRIVGEGAALLPAVPAWAGNTFMLDVVRAGARVFLYEKGYLHAKTISIDSEICSVGSTNIDIRSFSINYEINAVLYSERLARELEEDFERDLAYRTEFDPAEYRSRKVGVRLRDSAARLLSPLL